MNILHISTECYPAAKAGGLGDVVGALPKYLKQQNVSASVVIPKYQTKWLENNSFSSVYKGTIRIHKDYLPFSIEQLKTGKLDFPLFVVNLPKFFDRKGIYNDISGKGFPDNMERFLAFDLAVLEWLANSPGHPDCIHCHDHPTGMISFLMKNAPAYSSLSKIPTLLTIHNASYHGEFEWTQLYKLPWFNGEARGILDWNDQINPLAVGIKTAWRFTTVSPSYLEEIKHQGANGLEWLIHYEQHKAIGILNGIDTFVWDPETDTYLNHQLEDGNIESFKRTNKAEIKELFEFEEDFPIITFIGRLAYEKGADLLPTLIRNVFASGLQVNIVVLGTGDENVMEQLAQLESRLHGRLGVALKYDETLAHQLYAGSDFLLMPSRVEPCGLNQMYAMRYGTIPVVRSVGGLRDTVPDIGELNGIGRGIRFDQFTVQDAYLGIYRATELYYKGKEQFEAIRKRIMEVDFSWEKAAKQYLNLYKELSS